jgi:hypothetical protein
MAKGSQSKTLIGNALLQIFPGAFIDADQKTVRIPTTCEGEPLEIKITMTCAKDLIGSTPAIPTPAHSATPQDTAMTDAEIAEIKTLIKRLGL